jgi:hypothetical protein
MSRFTRVALVLVAVVSFSLSAVLVAAAARWLQRPAAAATAAVVRASTRVALPWVGAAIAASSEDCTPGASCLLASHGYSTYSDESDGLGVALIEPGDENDNMTIDLDGHHPDVDQLLREDKRAALWFVRNAEEWVTRDPDIVARARTILAPLRAIGHEMGEVGRQMGAQGSEQGRWGGEMGRVGARIGALSAQRALQSQDASDRDQLDQELAQARTEMNRLSARMAEARSRSTMNELGGRMRELSRRHRAALREARPRIRALVEEAVREHRAERLGVGA